jgi:hypothetical protein
MECRVSRKVELVTLALTFVGVIVAVLAWQWPVVGATSSTTPQETSYSSPLNTIKEIALPRAVLSVSGTGTKVEIRNGESGVRYSGGEISSTGSSSVVYLPLRQPLTLNISGTGATIAIASALMPYIEVNNVATGATLIEY